jgi:hypothetical protein
VDERRSGPRDDSPDRRRRLDEVFGEVLPTTTSDERDPEPPDTGSDEWYERDRPPHHGT